MTECVQTPTEKISDVKLANVKSIPCDSALWFDVIFSPRFRRKSTTLTVASCFSLFQIFGPLFVQCALLPNVYLILKAFKASNMKYATIPKQKGSPFHSFGTARLPPGFLSLSALEDFFKNFLLSRKVPIHFF